MKRLGVVGLAVGLALGCAAPKTDTSDKPETSPKAQQERVGQGIGTPIKKQYTPAELAKEVGLKMYPGAEAPDMMSRVPVELPTGERRYELVLATKDPIAKVVAWFEKELGLTSMKMDDGNQLVGRVDGKDVMVGVGPENGQTFIRMKAILYPKKGE